MIQAHKIVRSIKFRRKNLMVDVAGRSFVDRNLILICFSTILLSRNLSAQFESEMMIIIVKASYICNYSI